MRATRRATPRRAPSQLQMDALAAWLPSRASRECRWVSARPTRRTRPPARHRAATFCAREADGITLELNHLPVVSQIEGPPKTCHGALSCSTPLCSRPLLVTSFPSGFSGGSAHGHPDRTSVDSRERTHTNVVANFVSAVINCGPQPIRGAVQWVSQYETTI